MCQNINVDSPFIAFLGNYQQRMLNSGSICDGKKIKERISPFALYRFYFTPLWPESVTKLIVNHAELTVQSIKNDDVKISSTIIRSSPIPPFCMSDVAILSAKNLYSCSH